MSSVCPKIVDMMLDYERLTTDQRQIVDEHAAHCDDCREELEMINEVGVIFDHDEVIVPEDFSKVVMSMVDPPETQDRSRPIVWWLAGLVTALLILVAVLQTGAPQLLGRIRGWFGTIDMIGAGSKVTDLFSGFWISLQSFNLPPVPAGVNLATVLGCVAVILLFTGALIYHERPGNVE